MAAPEIAFTIAVVPGRRIFETPIQATNAKFVLPLKSQPYAEPRVPAWNLTNVNPRVLPHVATIITMIPRPPMGRLLISTFPAIYKERNSYMDIIASPRVYPPIYITHLTT